MIDGPLGFSARILFAVLLLACIALWPGCKSSIQTARGSRLGAQAPEPLLVTSVEPAPGLAEVGPLSVYRVTFSAEVDAGSLGTEPLAVTNLVSASAVAGKTTLEDGGKSLVFRAEGGLRPGAQYSVDVSPGLRSAAGGGYGGAAPGGPGLPAYYATFSEPPVLRGALTFVEATSSSLSLEWSPASDNSSPDGGRIVYDLYIARSVLPLDLNGTPEMSTPPGVTASVVTRLEAGLEYRVAIRARDPAGNPSAPSNEVIASTKPTLDGEPPLFGGITGLEADPDFPTTLTAVWEAGQDRPDPGAPLLYNVYVSLEPGKQDFRIPTRTTIEPNATTVVIDGLAPDTEYFVVVRAMDPTGNEEDNTVEARQTTPVSFAENVFKILTLPGGYDPGLCWPPCANPTQPGGCAKTRCHVGRSPGGGLDLTTYDGLFKKATTVIVSQPERSLLISRMRSTGTNRMPQDGTCPLEGRCIDAIERWIRQGANNN